MLPLLAQIPRPASSDHFPSPFGLSQFTVVETSIPDTQLALEKGLVTSRGLVLQYLARIATYEDKLNGVITVNSGALGEARSP